MTLPAIAFVHVAAALFFAGAAFANEAQVHELPENVAGELSRTILIIDAGLSESRIWCWPRFETAPERYRDKQYCVCVTAPCPCDD